MISGLAQWRNRSNSCSNTLDGGSECSLASSTGGTSAADQTDGKQRRYGTEQGYMEGQSTGGRVVHSTDMKIIR